MKGATVDNVTIGSPWAPIIDPSCMGRSAGPLTLTLDYETETQRDCHVVAEVRWRTDSGHAQALVDVPTVLTLGARCVAVRARALGSEVGQDVSVSAQVVAAATVVRHHPRYSERVGFESVGQVRPVPHWAEQLQLRSPLLYAPLFAQVELLADEAATDVLDRSQLNQPVPIVSSMRWYRLININADATLIWTLSL